MADPDALLGSGDVAGARAALVDIVRRQPADERARMFLFQLLCVTGEWDKARKQLQSLVQVASGSEMLGVTYNQALDAEAQRNRVHAGEEDMPVLVGSGGWIDGVARAISLTTRGDVAGAEAARDEAFAEAPDTPGELDGERFEWIADADVRFGPTFEAIVAGRYGLVPFEAVKSIRFEGPQDLRDLVWLPVEMALRSGQSVAAFLPARYPGSEAAGESAIVLARATNWADRDWGQAGVGQRVWSLSDGSDVGILGIKSIAFD
jgi:type VI secretion system protein ImpE